MQVWKDGRRVSSGSINCRIPDFGVRWTPYSQVLHLLMDIAGESAAREIIVSWPDLQSAEFDMYRLYDILHGAFQFSFMHTANTPETLTHVLYHAVLAVGDHSYSVLVERPITSDRIFNEKRQIECGNATLVEKFALRTSDENATLLIVKDYDRRMAEVSDLKCVFGLGDIIDRLATAQNASGA